MEESERPNRTERIDWDKLLDDDDPPPVLIVTRSSPGPAPAMESDDGIAGLSDQKLAESIASKVRTLRGLQRSLPDGGDKLRSTLKRLEEEQERRKLRRVEKAAEEVEEPTKSAGAIAHEGGIFIGTDAYIASLKRLFAKFCAFLNFRASYAFTRALVLWIPAGGQCDLLWDLLCCCAVA